MAENGSDEFPGLPLAVSVVEVAGPYVRLTGMPQSVRREAWRLIRSNNPALAVLLQEELLQDALRLFDADLFVDARWVPGLATSKLIEK